MATFGTTTSRIETSIDKVPVTPMTDMEIDTLRQRVDAARRLDLPQLHDASNPRSRLYVMTLDGTQNDAINDPEHITNVGLIDRMILRQDDPRMTSGYTKGVGNQRFVAGVIDSTLGLTVEEQATEAYNKFVIQANAWHRADPEVMISLAGVAFSRGSTGLLVASNLVHEKGIPDLSSPFTLKTVVTPDGQSHAEKVYSRFIIPPGEVKQALILNDQVATGKSEKLDRTVPPSVVSIVQLKAEHEYREKFPFYDAQDPDRPAPSIVTLSFPGAHSDVGGSYNLNGISSQTLLTNVIILNKFGANLPEPQPETDPAKYVIHDSEYLWDDRHAESPTPPLETRHARTVVLPEKTQQHTATSSPAPFSFRDQAQEALSGMTPEQLQVIFSRMQEHLLAQPEILANEAGMSR